MELVNNVAEYLKSSGKGDRKEAPEGVCANCWGVQEYDNMIRELYHERQINVNNHMEHYAFLQEFVVNHLDGIHLKKMDDKLTCPNCHIHYKD